MRKSRSVLRLMGEALHGLHGANGFRGMAGGIGNAVLAGARQTAHHAAEDDDGHDHGRQSQRGKAGKAGARIDQHESRADKHKRIAKRDGSRGTDHSFNQRHIGCQAR